MYIHIHLSSHLFSSTQTHIYILPTVHRQQINKVIICMFTHTMQVL